MAFLNKGKKTDLYTLALELGLTVTPDDKIVTLREKIITCSFFKDDIEFVKDTFSTIVDDRKKQEDENVKKLQKEEDDRLRAERQLAEERAFELEKLKLQSQDRGLTPITSTQGDHNQIRIDLKNILPTFAPDKDDMSLFLTMFERQMKLLNIPPDFWVSHLIGILPNEICKLVAREDEAMFKNYSHIRNILLERFKLTAERFRILFSRHQKRNTGTWKDFYFELRNYFEGWLTELEITSFDKLKDLIIADQIKRKCSLEYKNHYLDGWETLNDPVLLAEKLDIYDNIKLPFQKLPNASKHRDNQQPVFSKSVPSPDMKRNEIIRNENNKFSGISNTFSPNSQYMPSRHVNNSGKRPTLNCYGCGKEGFIKAKCPNCSPHTKVQFLKFESLHLHSCSVNKSRMPLLYLKVNGITGVACADTGATHSIAGEMLFNLLREQGVFFEKSTMKVTLADGLEKDTDILQAKVSIELEGRTISTKIFAFPHTKGNKTLLGIDFLTTMGVVLDIRNKHWYFHNNPRRKFSFAESPFITTPEISTVTEADPSVLLRENEGPHLSPQQRKQLNDLLVKYEQCFRPGGEPTPFIEHHINTGDHLPVSVPPYRMTPAKKDLLKKEIDKLLAEGIIEEAESPYASPVVLIPKPNGTIRLCVDYRKLNSITVSDSYPLPRMDDLLHEAKPTPFMTTIDLKSGYHQVKVHPDDQDKTAFVCPFGTFRYLRMPFGLKNAPATFQRLIDRFRNGLDNVLSLAFLDDIIILSETFEQHLIDLKAVFERLLLFKLHANRVKCNFACSKVKYLGFWITQNGIEVDPEKISSIQKIPPPTNVKQVQSFLQTCSWFRRYIQNFAEISRPLSELTKKKSQWKWEFNQQHAFETLKKCLTTPPVLKQADGTKPYIIRTDASNYALGAVLLQGKGSEEHPVEYASRLLSHAERNYSTTEREALAVVWALKKFRGYIDGSEITVESDHQALKWLLNLKSPTGRLARWALEIQSYNLKLVYVPGKANVIADLLSRPVSDIEINEAEMCNFVSIDMPTRSASDIREAQLADENLKKIIHCFENDKKDENFANWTERGYIMNQGILYRYAPDSDTEEAQLVIPAQERELIMKLHHDSSTAGHYGEEGTFHRIAKRYYWTGMKSYISNYVKKCPECCRFKAANQKPAGLLRTPAYAQRFETLSIDLFGPLPEAKQGHKWILIVQDCATKWVELFPLITATARECATTLIEEVFFRYGIPRKLISDNGPQFVSAVLQQVCCTLHIDQILTPVYHPQANPVERKNRDLKPRLAILVGDAHDTWPEHLSNIRFALNTSKSDTTGHTAAFLQFGRELRTIDDVVYDMKAVLENDNFVPEITPYLKRLAKISKEVKERVEMKQDKRKNYYDQNRKTVYFKPGEKVWVVTHLTSNAHKKKTAKFMPKRDGPYLIVTQRSPVSYDVANLDRPDLVIGTYHVSALKPFIDVVTTPTAPLRRRGRPPKNLTPAATRTNECHNPVSLSRRQRSQRGRL